MCVAAALEKGEPLDTKLAALLTKDGGHQGEEGVPGTGGLEVSPILLFGALGGLCGGGDEEGSEDTWDRLLF